MNGIERTKEETDFQSLNNFISSSRDSTEITESVKSFLFLVIITAALMCNAEVYWIPSSKSVKFVIAASAIISAVKSTIESN